MWHFLTKLVVRVPDPISEIVLATIFDAESVVCMCKCKQEWELVVLQVLRYDICAITPHDFVDLLLCRLPIGRDLAATVRQHTQTFVALCATGS